MLNYSVVRARLARWPGTIASRATVGVVRARRLCEFCSSAVAIAWLSTAMLAVSTVLAAESDREGEAYFESKIRPLLVEHCYRCHSGDRREGELLLDRRDGLLQGGESGPAVIPGKPDESLLVRAVRRADDVSAMPPDKPLSPEQVALLEQWVRLGLPDPRSEKTPARLDPAQHWAFKLPQRPALPASPPAARGPLDAFAFASLTAHKLAPSPEAEPRVLIRRVAYDLTGLPPTAEMLRVADDWSDRRYEQLVDSLLNSPQFGERWARYWLDVSRYADTKGYVFQEDRNYPEAYRYRDWVIQAFNADLPYDEFLKLQLAADLLRPDQPDQWVAMGFLTLGRRFLNNIHDIIDDRIDVVSRGTMALTVSCARCHNHKFDPIPTEDYYSLYSVFFSSDEPKDGTPLRLADHDKPRDVRVFLRGNSGNRGEVAPRGFLRLLNDGEPLRFQNGSGRLELAESIASHENPLTARVLVNRVWGRLFGRHLVSTPSDFGVRTELPTQRPLLDYLSTRLMERQWSLKLLIREIVLSAVYRQSSLPRADAAQVDPENSLLWRMNRRRLDLESMRDTLLSVSGELDDARVGGKSEDIVSSSTRRRTLYAHIDRQNLPGVFRVFDFATPDTHNPRRPLTSVPQQALFLMNNQLMAELSQQMAARTGSLQPRPRIEALFRQVYGRSATESELQWCEAMLAECQRLADAFDGQTWRHGYGKRDDKGHVAEFHLLPRYEKDRWQGGEQLPDPRLGWAMLSKTGGHPGMEWAAIRRWVAPRDGVLTIRGLVKHPADQGDGVQASVVSSREGAIWNTAVRTSEKSLDVQVTVKQGDTIDLVAEAGESANHDSFHWTVTLTLDDAEGAAPSGGRRRWDSQEDFGPRVEPLSPWAQLAQALLMSNELLFLD
ncbi:MAG: PSD1 domain-containing protein [Planctomycetales bacterium]|nr:PSD1 domain-containing protein [Planctomycetales bacterium]